MGIREKITDALLEAVARVIGLAFDTATLLCNSIRRFRKWSAEKQYRYFNTLLEELEFWRVTKHMDVSVYSNEIVIKPKTKACVVDFAYLYGSINVSVLTEDRQLVNIAVYPPPWNAKMCANLLVDVYDGENIVHRYSVVLVDEAVDKAREIVRVILKELKHVTITVDRDRVTVDIECLMSASKLGFVTY